MTSCGRCEISLMNNFDRWQTRYGFDTLPLFEWLVAGVPGASSVAHVVQREPPRFADNSANAENSAASSALSVNFSEAYEWSFLCGLSLRSSLEIADDIKD